MLCYDAMRRRGVRRIVFRPLFNKLGDRQLDPLDLNLRSVGPNFGVLILTFAERMGLPDTGLSSVAERSALQFRALKTALACGEMRILGLVRASIRATSTHRSLIDNHQVLARCLTQVLPAVNEPD